MSRFSTALTTWFTARKISLRDLSESAGLNNALMSLWKAGKRPITFEALGKLLPAIERHSTRTDALYLHVAYLLDEIVAGYEADLNVTAIDGATKAPRADTIQERASRWIKKARTDSEFEVMWNSLDGYMSGREELIKGLAIEVLAHEEDAKRKGAAFSDFGVGLVGSSLMEEPLKTGIPVDVSHPPSTKSVNYKDALRPRRAKRD